jgi:hypothetical protein
MIEYTVKVDVDGTRWYLDGKRHREDGPAIEHANGYKAWYLNGKCHREDGPAIERANGDKFWYIDDKRLTEEEFKAHTNNCNGKEVVIDGKTYILSLK